MPFTVTVVIPGILLIVFGPDTLGVRQAAPTTRFMLPAAGGALMIIGLSLMISTIRLFVNIGKGSLAPWNPTQKLVVRGPYRHVRNPMISGVFLVLLGESLGLASLPLLALGRPAPSRST